MAVGCSWRLTTVMEFEQCGFKHLITIGDHGIRYTRSNNNYKCLILLLPVSISLFHKTKTSKIEGIVKSLEL
ncbi:hypothetical protein F8M41_014812 [Gigaspora margarita]|uniref:Uncharacterized protein n=1 Tax=Gigaspora margarita TaxID=4874 RepID=A0A8H3ZZN1_GIGMA|nr:hypothetical protein F8M41_014812 [Gigaspora margarita]